MKINKQKEEFIAMISHELKTSIQPIIGYCELLQNTKIEKLDSKEQNYVNEIVCNSLHLAKLVNDLLDVCKLDMNRLTLTITKFSIRDFLNRVMKDITPLMSNKQIEFLIYPVENKSIQSDHTRLLQIFYNLIENAIDFVPDKGGKIEILTTIDHRNIVFCIKDNGKGITKNAQKHLFSQFYQADVKHSRKHGGTGLGLSICKRLVENLGGHIWVESCLNKGTAFFFSIPISYSTENQIKTEHKTLSVVNYSC